MQVIKCHKSSGYPLSTHKFFDFQRFSDKTGDFLFLEGGFEQVRQWEQFGFSEKKLKALLKKKIVMIELEEPNKLFVGDRPYTYDYYFHKILTICPFTAEWLNKLENNNKRVFVFYPFNENYIPKKEEKIYDVIYAGNIVNEAVLDEVKTITRYNYRFISMSSHPLVTDKNASHKKKMKLIAQSKITLVHNMLFVKPYHAIRLWGAKKWEQNKAFRYVPRWFEIWKFFNGEEIIAPHQKSRLFEAAFGRSLILCRKDPFNVIEYFFKENKEFVYYDKGELDEKIKFILANYHKYRKIAENAYQRARRQYTTKVFFDNYLKNLA